MANEKRTIAQQIAWFTEHASFEDLTQPALDRLKISLLDALGCAIGALDGDPIRRARQQVDELGGRARCTLIGGGRSSPDRAAFMNSGLVRYLDFMDNFLAKGETCHPSDNIGSVLAAAEYADRDGRDLLTALAVAYQIECRLTEEAPIMAHGFDHTTQLSFSIAAGVAKALGLSEERTANALAICGSDFATLAVVRSSPTSIWKGFESAGVAAAATHATLLAGRGLTGPLQVFEGVGGFFHALRKRFRIDWEKEGLAAVTLTSIKRFDAEVHTQSAIEGILELRAEHDIDPVAVESVHVETFLTAYDIVGGGKYGDRRTVQTKEQADHSMPYLLAVALIDGDVWPEQFDEDRIRRPDVQRLLARVTCKTKLGLSWPRPIVERLDPYTRAYPDETPARVTIRLRGGRSLTVEKRDWHGHRTRPWTWEQTVSKFDRLSQRYADPPLRREISSAVSQLEHLKVSDLTRLLAEVGSAAVRRRAS